VTVTVPVPVPVPVTVTVNSKTKSQFEEFVAKRLGRVTTGAYRGKWLAPVPFLKGKNFQTEREKIK
jgi:hypothetical protein